MANNGGAVMRRSMILWLGLILLSATSLFLIKTEVQHREEKLTELHRDIVREQQAIHVLKAEWSYLNRPDRLADLVARHLELVPIDRGHLAAFDVLPSRPNPLTPTPKTQVVSVGNPQ